LSPLPVNEREMVMQDPGFGDVFTDHMVQIRWIEEQGWHDPAVVPYQPLTVDPASFFIHYGQSIFEGLKAYAHDDGGIYAFRPEQNARRFQRSAQRLAMAQLPEDLFLESLKVLVTQDRGWVPNDAEKSLYLRPFMFATEVGLGVKPSDEYLYLLIASPAGPYFKGGLKPVTVWLCEDFVRAAPGGTGEAKCAGNYAASLLAQAEAIDNDCDQVVWLDASEHRWVEEMGGMNLYFVYGEGANARLVTPALTGSLLPGVTRDSLLRLAADLGYEVEEGKINVDDWRKSAESGELTEVFACGTAAVITPVGHVKGRTGNWSMNAGAAGPITQQLREALLGIQTGTMPDEHNWMTRLA